MKRVEADASLENSWAFEVLRSVLGTEEARAALCVEYDFKDSAAGSADIGHDRVDIAQRDRL